MKNTIHKGWLSLEASLAILFILVVLTYGIQGYNQYVQKLEWKNITDKTSIISDAAQRYIADNYADLLAKSSTTTPALLSVADLINAGYLHQGYSSTNSYGQEYIIYVQRNAKKTDMLNGFILTRGGNPLSYEGMRTVSASVISGMGGYVLGNQAVGAYQGWTFPLSTLGLSLPDGHLAVDLTDGVLNTTSDESDRLYRYKVNARPELNRMSTAIDMGGNSVNNADQVNGNTGTFQNNVTSSGGDFVTAGSHGWINTAHQGGFYMDDDTWVKSLNGKGILTTGPVQGETVRANSRLSGGEYLQLDGVAVAGAACTGRILGLDSSGALVTCQAGKWQGLSGGTFSRIGSEQLTITSPGSYKNILVTVSSLFNGQDGSHTAYADFTLTVNGSPVGTLRNQVVVSKGGSSGHKWLYQSHAITQQMFTVPVSNGSQIAVTRGASYLYVSGDIRIDLTD